MTGLFNKLCQIRIQYFLQLIAMCFVGFHEQKATYAHGWVHDVASLDNAMEMFLNLLKIKGFRGLVRLIQNDKAEHIIFDAVPHRFVIWMDAFEIALHWQQATGVTCQVV